MGLQGDFAKLRELRQKLARAADPAQRYAMNRILGAEALSLLKLGFRSSVDPYGATWAPLSHRKGKPLLDTGRLRNSFSSQASADGFRIGTNVVYAPHHQYGTNGRKSAGGFSMPTDERGRFMKRKAAGVKRGKKVQVLWHSFKRMNFSAGSGKVPARMMLPIASRGLGTWRDPLHEAATRFLSRLLR